ncbi:putative kora protein (plasmid) [Xanthomonas albilineans]|uniref:Putative kora protein n=1 Tax=Xanthomonas albilineans (strain GPE PC73 / CFBP 7063) TaxID=380358 RepID=D6CK97_XANAP|nr:putative kora protein [Xanthomonas albilineans]
MRVFLILQRQLEDLFHKDKVTKTSIQRMGQKQWIPLFEVIDTDGSTITCSLRLQSSSSVRSWANLTLLVEWLREKFGVERCDLLLSDRTQPLTERTDL